MKNNIIMYYVTKVGLHIISRVKTMVSRRLKLTFPVSGWTTFGELCLPKYHLIPNTASGAQVTYVYHIHSDIHSESLWQYNTLPREDRYKHDCKRSFLKKRSKYISFNSFN